MAGPGGLSSGILLLLLLIDIHVCGCYLSYMESLGDFHVVVVVVGASERMNKQASEQVS